MGENKTVRESNRDTERASILPFRREFFSFAGWMNLTTSARVTSLTQSTDLKVNHM